MYLFIDVGWHLNLSLSVHLNSYKSYAVVGLLINHVCRNYDL